MPWQGLGPRVQEGLGSRVQGLYRAQREICTLATSPIPPRGPRPIRCVSTTVGVADTVADTVLHIVAGSVVDRVAAHTTPVLRTPVRCTEGQGTRVSRSGV
eukprot:698717-Rhodomonas_salina.2